MEAFSLLNDWRTSADASLPQPPTTTIVTAVTAPDTDDKDGPFFDLELALPDDDNENQKTQLHHEETEQNPNHKVDSDGSDCDCDGGEFNFTLSSDSNNDRSDPTAAESPSDDLFFQGRLVSIEPNASLEAKSPKFPVSLLKSATKARVLLLKFKKSRPNTGEKAGEVGKKPETGQEEKTTNNKIKLFTVKFKVEEAPIVSLFSRDNSKSQKQQSNEETASDEKRFSKEVMQKYLKKVKPLYVRVSRRYGDKVRFSGQVSLDALKPGARPKAAEKAPSEVEQTGGKSQRQGSNIQAGLRVVYKHLGKSKSASSAAVAAAPPVPVPSRRRDDSLLQQQDGIQSAILHCKRSFNGSRDSEASVELSAKETK